MKTEAQKLYDEANLLNYGGGNSNEALNLYKRIISDYAESPQAEYAQTHIDKLEGVLGTPSKQAEQKMGQKKSGFIPDYQAGKSVCNVISIFGWIAVILGFMLAYMGAVSTSTERLVTTLVAAAPGLGFVVAGFLNVAMGQIGVATIDNANANREILYLTKQGGNLLKEKSA